MAGKHQGFWKKKNSPNWYCRIRTTAGKWVERSTGTKSLQEARVVRSRLQHELHQDDAASESEAVGVCKLSEALGALISDKRRQGRSESTTQMYETKAGHLNRLIGHDTDINELDLDQHIRPYVDGRKKEKASQSTIHKELGVLYRALRAAGRRFRGRIEDLKIRGFGPNYKPRSRWLPEEEYKRLEAQLPEQRRWHLRFFVLTGARQGEADRCELKHVDFERGLLTLPGTKTELSRRPIPFTAFPELEALLRELVAEVPEGETRLLPRWHNIRRDLADACAKAKIDRVSPNDLRRTFCSWLANRGVNTLAAAKLMGHASTRMVEQVYAQLHDDTLSQALGALEGLSLGPLNSVPASGTVQRAEGQNRTADTGIFSPLLYRLSYLGVQRYGGYPGTS
jgi:integrase